VLVASETLSLLRVSVCLAMRDTLATQSECVLVASETLSLLSEEQTKMIVRGIAEWLWVIFVGCFHFWGILTRPWKLLGDDLSGKVVQQDIDSLQSSYARASGQPML
jgi:hypothetical protein